VTPHRVAHFKEIQMVQKTEVGFVKMDPNDPEQCATAVDALYNFLMEQIAKAKEMRAQEQEAAKVKEAPSDKS
jgi:hypothetical protein